MSSTMLPPSQCTLFLLIRKNSLTPSTEKSGDAIKFKVNQFGIISTTQNQIKL